MDLKSSLMLILFLIFSSCETGLQTKDEMTDDQIISEIIESDKIVVTSGQLPSQARDVVDSEYADYKEIDLKKASDLGYELAMGGRRNKIGKHTKIYFTIEGRKLNPYKRDKDDWDKGKLT